MSMFVDATQPLADLSHLRSDPQLLAAIPIGFARQQGVVVLVGPGGPVLAMTRPDPQTLDIVRRSLGRRLPGVFASAEQVRTAIDRVYQQIEVDSASLVDPNSLDSTDPVLSSREDLLDSGDRAPVIKLVNTLLYEALRAQASDIHLQPTEQSLQVRMRIDGMLHDWLSVPLAMRDHMLSRFKVMAGMNLAEKRLAQDGRSAATVGDRVVDLRFSSVPSSFGERIVVRLLDKQAKLFRLSDVGMPAELAARFARLITADHGIILVTGPTGSGKTTTLYGALQELNTTRSNIITLEDPVEYSLPGISQIQVSDKKGMTFASGLRNVLRQDPDVIMVGEIRDRETASMAIQSALTGHLVFSTLHTNDAATAVTRLLDLSVEPYLLASSVIGVLAQRLVRLTCPGCRISSPLPNEVFEDAGVSDREGNWCRGAGCARCRGTGFKGRRGIFELLEITEPVRSLIVQRATAAEIKQLAISGGMSSLRDQGIARAREGITTLDEIFRVTMRTSG
ncbi:MAG TPA: ATPase, T2SS/T4P/T4SS family [Tepidisphaeraceae bacterium]|nr:ATPase, T2SS/T4P/T4SS family [Tepidisphaeraceae bacterium]